MSLTDDLRAVPSFADLSADDLDWLAAHAVERRFQVGEIAFRQGEPAEEMTILLEGALEGRPENDASDSRTFQAQAPMVTGRLPYSRMTHFQSTGRVTEAARVLRIHRDLFPEMLYRIPALGERLVQTMTDRVRETTRTDEQRGKLEALGRLSAGLAHELNNPAAAARRSSAELRAALERLAAANLALHAHALSVEQHTLIAQLERDALSGEPDQLSAIEFSEREDELITWLETVNVPDAYEIAPKLIESGLRAPALERLEHEIPRDLLPEAIARVTASLEANRLVLEIEQSISRVSELVLAIKAYSYMDSGGTQAVDVNQGLKDTLTVLGFKWRKKNIGITRTLDAALPKIQAQGGQLNQVWTNLLDNAIDALPEGGQLRLSTSPDADDRFVRVLIEDDGPGIPRDIQERIFEPFFTTKPVGEGTGLGLDTVRRIVRQHHGEIRLESQPGRTRFTVRLPKG